MGDRECRPRCPGKGRNPPRWAGDPWRPLGCRKEARASLRYRLLGWEAPRRRPPDGPPLGSGSRQPRRPRARHRWRQGCQR
eukprot:8966728-Alexandrium_andersonii.AAC.1